MLRPDLFQGFASHAGGGLFEVSIRPFFRVAARRLRDGLRRLDRALPDELRRGPAPLAHPLDLHVLLQWGFSAAYSADPDGDDSPPLRRRNGTGDPRALGTVARVGLSDARPAPCRGSRGMRAIYVDAGTSDEWYLDLTAEWLRRELTALGVPDLRVELFDATHLAIEYRYPIGLRYLADRLR
jgi:hypothetical protein